MKDLYEIKVYVELEKLNLERDNKNKEIEEGFIIKSPDL